MASTSYGKANVTTKPNIVILLENWSSQNQPSEVRYRSTRRCRGVLGLFSRVHNIHVIILFMTRNKKRPI